jgi:hypothetical protein
MGHLLDTTNTLNEKQEGRGKKLKTIRIISLLWDYIAHLNRNHSLAIGHLPL